MDFLRIGFCYFTYKRYRIRFFCIPGNQCRNNQIQTKRRACLPLYL